MNLINIFKNTLSNTSSKILLIILLSSFMFLNTTAFAQSSLFDKGEHYFFNGKFAMAERFLLQALDADPENPQIYTYLGDILFLRNKHIDALKMYRIVDELRPSGQNCFRMGQVYYDLNDGRSAIANFRRTIEIDPSIKFAYYHIGLTYLMIFREKENAIAFWKKFIEVSPEDPQIETIKEAVDILSNPAFILPPFGSNVSVAQALKIGGYSPIEETNSRILFKSREPVRTFYEKMDERAIRMESKSDEQAADQTQKNETRAKQLSNKADETVNDSAKKNEDKANRLLHRSEETHLNEADKPKNNDNVVDVDKTILEKSFDLAPKRGGQ